MDNTCICCGRIIPEGRHICLLCGEYDDMQTFKPRKESEMKYFIIRDECGWKYYIATDRTDLTAKMLVLLTPHVRSACEISETEYSEATQ